MSEESSEKKHQATGKRLTELRKRGQTLRSRDLTSGMLVLVSIMALIYMADNFRSVFESNFIITFAEIKNVMHDVDFPVVTLRKLALDSILLILPFFAVLLIISFLSPFLFGGWNFTLDVVKFNGSKLNPVSNLKNIFSKKIFVELTKSLVKFIIIVTTLVLFSGSKLSHISFLLHLPLHESISASYVLAKEYIAILCGAIIFIGAADALYHFFEYQNRNKMTTQEVKDEFKETEGNTDVKRKMRSAQIAMLKQRLSITVPKAHVIITNPTHYAIALRYDEKKDKAPKIVAKGKDHTAAQIRQLAISHGIPIYQAPVLARAIYHTSNIGSEIHPGLYMSVAIVLSYVHQLKNYQYGIGQMPYVTSDLKVPEELVYDE